MSFTKDQTTDRIFLTEMSIKMGVSQRRIRLNEYRWVILQGDRSTINYDGKWWYFNILDLTPMKWRNVKKKLSFMEVSQDGDDEGVLRLDRMPTDEECEIIRKIGGFRKSVKGWKGEKKIT